MVETFNNLMLGFSVALQPSVLVYAFVGCLIGTLVGMMPGLGPLAGISLLLPASGPRPGIMPTSVPIRQPTNAYTRIDGCSATEKPSSRF